MKNRGQWLPIVATGIGDEFGAIRKGSPKISYEAAMQAAEKMFADCGENAQWFGVRKIR